MKLYRVFVQYFGSETSSVLINAASPEAAILKAELEDIDRVVQGVEEA